MLKKISIIILVLIFGISLYNNIKAFSGGIVNLTHRAGNTEGCTCHGIDTTATVRILINGPSIVHIGDTVTYTAKLTGDTLTAAGINISAGNGKVILFPLDTNLQMLEASFGIYELTHTYPKTQVNDTVSWKFRYIAPMIPGNDTLFSTGNSVNLNGNPSGDKWNFGINKIVNVTTASSITENFNKPFSFILHQNFPNPFNPSTKIKYSLKNPENVLLSVYDTKGTLIKTLVNKKQNAGEYEIDFNATTLPSGVYFYKLTTGAFSETKSMLLIK